MHFVFVTLLIVSVCVFVHETTAAPPGYDLTNLQSALFDLTKPPTDLQSALIGLTKPQTDLQSALMDLTKAQTEIQSAKIPTIIYDISPVQIKISFESK